VIPFQSQAISYEGGVTFRSLTPISKLHIELERGKYDTLDKVFTYAINKNGAKKCLGTREVIDEEEEVQPNGRVFKKHVLGEYLWKSYNEINILNTKFSRGLRELGLEPKSRVCIFAETRAEWLIAAMAAFRQNLTSKDHLFPKNILYVYYTIYIINSCTDESAGYLSVVTLYATLGDEAVVHGINETEVKHIITTHDLLPKFKKILSQTPTVTTIVYMEDPLKKGETSGFKEGVKIHSFCDIIALGSRSSKGGGFAGVTITVPAMHNANSYF
jgi:long-chain acyl-CoA synthetase